MPGFLHAPQRLASLYLGKANSERIYCSYRKGEIVEGSSPSPFTTRDNVPIAMRLVLSAWQRDGSDGVSTNSIQVENSWLTR